MISSFSLPISVSRSIYFFSAIPGLVELMSKSYAYIVNIFATFVKKISIKYFLIL